MICKKTENHKISRGILMLLFAAIGIVACQDYDNGYTEKQLGFIRDFKAIYGEVDPTQDWNLAERGSVTVTTSSPSNIKIYAKAKGKYTIVGDYQGVSGTRTLGFDVVEGTEDIIVTDGVTAEHTTCGGGSVAFLGTRGILPSGTLVEKTAEQKVFGKDLFESWAKYVPQSEFNINKVSVDFLYVSTGEFTIYPIYWYTGNYLELGIYYKEPGSNEVKKTSIYKIKANRQGKDSSDSDDWEIVSNSNPYVETSYKGREGTGEIQFRLSAEDTWKDAYNEEVIYGKTDDVENVPYEIRTYGIKVNLPAGTVFGMYLITQEKNVYYSDSDLNPDIGFSYIMKDGKPVVTDDISKGAPHASTFTDTKGNVFLGFEDWLYGGGYKEGYVGCDFDLNDCLFVFGDPAPEILDDTADRWILSAEDLGNTYDLDYNDVVVEIDHISGHTTAYVTPLAAGGTLASFLYFKDKPVGNEYIGSDGKEKTGEIHELFGSANKKDISGTYTPINVSGTTPTQYSRTYVVDVDEDFSLASNVVGVVGTGNNSVEEMQTMGGFNIRVVQQGKKVNIDNANAQDAQKIQNVVVSEGEVREDNVPYVICTPKSWDGFDENGNPIKIHYRWAREKVPMLPTEGFNGAAYNGQQTFASWVANKNDAKEWYKYPDENVTCAPIMTEDEDIDPREDPELKVKPDCFIENDGWKNEGRIVNGEIYMCIRTKNPDDNTSNFNLAACITSNSTGKYRHTIISGNDVLEKFEPIPDNIFITGKAIGKGIVKIEQEADKNHKSASIYITVNVVEDLNNIP